MTTKNMATIKSTEKFISEDCLVVLLADGSLIEQHNPFLYRLLISTNPSLEFSLFADEGLKYSSPSHVVAYTLMTYRIRNSYRFL